MWAAFEDTYMLNVQGSFFFLLTKKLTDVYLLATSRLSSRRHSAGWKVSR